MENTYKEKALLMYIFKQIKNGNFSFNNKSDLEKEKNRLQLWIKENEETLKDVVHIFMDYYDATNSFPKYWYEIEIEGSYPQTDLWMNIKDFVETYYDHLSDEEYIERYAEIDREMDIITDNLVEIILISIGKYLYELQSLSENEFDSIMMFGRNFFTSDI